VTDLTLDNGAIKLAVSVYGVAGAEAVLFLHGLSQCRDTWEEIALRLMSRYQVWTLDFRGHGHSDRAPNYELAGYISDAETVLEAIGRPAIVVGHSLGGCVAGVLAQRGHANVRAVLLEDPPWYLGEPGEWEKSAFPRLFSIISTQQALWQREKAPLSTYLEFVSNAPSPMGGIASDHFGSRHLLSTASTLHRQDGNCWGNFLSFGEALATIATEREFLCPARIIHDDPRFGAALLEGHEARLRKTSPRVEIVHYIDSGHRPHAARGFEQRFIMDLEGFLSTLLPP
jgi:pimeloyl-ACP methyl ester carboxylesterase